MTKLYGYSVAAFTVYGWKNAITRDGDYLQYNVYPKCQTVQFKNFGWENVRKTKQLVHLILAYLNYTTY